MKLMSKDLNKKAAIEIQFNWIFVAIAGFVIFLFIIGIAVKNARDSEQKLSQDLISQIVASIKGKQQLSDAFTSIDIPKTNIQFSCDKDTDLAYIRIAQSQRQNLPVEIIFAPSSLDTDKLLLSTEDFSIPFTVTRFVYITSPETAFIVYYKAGGDLKAEAFFNALPSNITKVEATGSNLANKIASFKNFKIICFEECPTGKDYIQIIPNNPDIFSYGQINFHKGTSNKVTQYVTKASLLAAIYSDNKEYYECQMDRAFKQFEIKRKLQIERIELMEDDTDISYDCRILLIRPSTTLYALKDQKLIHNEDIYNIMRQFHDDNKDLELSSCPIIY